MHTNLHTLSIQTALMLACKNGRAACIERLVEWGANVSIACFICLGEWKLMIHLFTEFLQDYGLFFVGSHI